MLPWLFAVVLALNLAMVWWGRQHEIPIEPPLPPLAEAPGHIELLAAASELAEPPAAPQLNSGISASSPEPSQESAEGVPPHTLPADPPEHAQAHPETNVAGAGAATDLSPAIEPFSPLRADEPPREAPRIYLPDADPGAEPQPAALLDQSPAPGLEAALPAAAAATAAAASKAVKKRKVKRRPPKPAPAQPVE